MRVTSALIAILALRAPAVGAQRIGWPGTGGNGFPFIFSGVSRYQQVYAATQFRATTIAGIRFFRTVDSQGTGDVASARFSFALSTTNAAVNGLDTVNLSTNVGADNTRVLDSLIRGVNIPFGQSFTLMFTTPFNFDPVPEASTWSMMSAGLAMLVVVLVRRARARVILVTPRLKSHFRLDH